ncbi:DUF5127 domain-containing protein [Bacteroides sp.]|uniref:DUF5127 domain-containing protein n=1 Tax=Bacteroides sp. TaxID=29523 RepID=UPI0026359A83|nr:DUF5127 domain-containing protein [Bacteroides sp.]MDD3037201.1 DUF5127 domain-containing protein [Bacteroides sp.]
MEIKGKTNYNGKLLMICLYIISLLTACDSSEHIEVMTNDIHPSRHILLPLAPTFSVEVSGDTLHHQYLHIPKGKDFPLMGILYVDGKGYRFMGADSLRIQALAPLAGDSCGWKGKYSFLYPGDGWKEREYNDTGWHEGRAAFGTENTWYMTNTFWDAENIYVRRHVMLNKEALNNCKLYIRFLCDDVATIYCNGDEVVRFNYTNKTTHCRQLSDTIVRKLKAGDNVFAAHCYDISYNALLDYGLYAENKEYDDVDTARLKSVDIQATQTRYAFQCGSMELQLNFVSPSLLQNEEFMGCPVGFLSYQIVSTDGQQHDVDISFDMDMEWMSDRVKVKDSVEQGWKIIQGDSLYLAVKAEDVQSVCKDGRVILTQKNMMRKGMDRGVLLLGYEEGEVLQYFGENLPYYWQKNKNTSIKDVLRNIGDEYRSLQSMCNETDLYYSQKLSLQESKINAEKMLPYYRNFMATRRLSVAPDGGLLCYSSIVGRVRDAFDSFPYLMFFERMDWMKGTLKPVFDFCENGYWLKQFPPFDIGFFPIAIHQESVNDYGIEMASNMLMMTLAVVKADESFDYAEKHWKVISQWGNYLVTMVTKQQGELAELQKDSVRNQELLVKQLPAAYKDEVKSILGLIAYQELIELQKKR